MNSSNTITLKWWSNNIGYTNNTPLRKIGVSRKSSWWTRKLIQTQIWIGKNTILLTSIHYVYKFYITLLKYCSCTLLLHDKFVLLSAMAIKKDLSTGIRIPGFLTMFRICEVLGVFSIVYNPNKLHSEGKFCSSEVAFLPFCPSLSAINLFWELMDILRELNEVIGTDNKY